MNRRGFFGMLAGALTTALAGTRAAFAGKRKPVYGGDEGYWISQAPSGWSGKLERDVRIVAHRGERVRVKP